MLELGMIVCLALMGVYFFKSTDLPKELKERSAQSQTQVVAPQALKPKMTFPKIEINEAKKTAEVDTALEAKLLAMKQQKKLKDIALLQTEIDRLTLEITSLEQQIKDNNAKNAEIQNLIDARLITLMELQNKISTLA